MSPSVMSYTSYCSVLGKCFSSCHMPLSSPWSAHRPTGCVVLWNICETCSQTQQWRAAPGICQLCHYTWLRPGCQNHSSKPYAPIASTSLSRHKQIQEQKCIGFTTFSRCTSAETSIGYWLWYHVLVLILTFSKCCLILPQWWVVLSWSKLMLLC